MDFNARQPGEGDSTKFHTGRLRPEVQPLTLIHTTFDGKGTPFEISSIKRWYLFNIPRLEGCNSSNCCKCTVYITGSLEIRKYCCLFYIHEMRRLAPLGPFTDQNDRFSYPVIYFNQWSPCPFIYLKVVKGTPFGQSLPILTTTGSPPWRKTCIKGFKGSLRAYNTAPSSQPLDWRLIRIRSFRSPRHLALV